MVATMINIFNKIKRDSNLHVAESGTTYFVNVFIFLTLMLFLSAGQATETITYYHNDGLGSPVAATNDEGELLWHEDYRPYGERYLNESTDVDAKWYTGKPTEDETGLSYFGARWYDPKVGRFMAVDPVGVMPDNVHSFNRYAYANNNPYKYIDPDGRLTLFAQSLRRDFTTDQVTQISNVSNGALKLAGTTAAIVGSVTVPGPEGVAVGVSLIKNAKVLKNSDELIKVTRWGRKGLEEGDWVMKGGNNWWNYIWSGKWQPGMDNKFAPKKSSKTFKVPKSSIRNPRKGDTGTKYDTSETLKIKSWLKQRIYDPEKK
jgi:RHS repeat-associated protein